MFFTVIPQGVVGRVFSVLKKKWSAADSDQRLRLYEKNKTGQVLYDHLTSAL